MNGVTKMRRTTLPWGRFAVAAVLACATTAAAQSDASLPPLAQVERVRQELLAGAIGDEIQTHCPTISARMFRVLGRLYQLEQYALGLGYTREDISEMRRSPENRAELQRLRNEYLAANGVVEGQPDTYCALGRREIANGTFIGSLLNDRS
jgi:hypothetical protein